MSVTRYGVCTPAASTLVAIIAILAFTVGCKPEGFINRAKFNGKKVTNTCDQLKKELEEVLAMNEGTGRLTVSDSLDPSTAGFLLEPGQFEQIGDTLYFRLANDLLYEKYLQKGIAFHIKASYKSPKHLDPLEKDKEGEFDQLILDRKYYESHKNPDFLYAIPTSKHLDGKEFTLNFSVVKYNKKGVLKKVLCNSQDVPLGPLEAPCCTDKPWDKVELQSVVQTPEIDVKDESYNYKGFTGTLDIIFPMNSVEMINRTDLNKVILEYAQKYEAKGFKLKSVAFDGYASQGGLAAYNQKLSEKRCEVVYSDIRKHFETLKRADSIKIAYRGMGEDWERFDLLVETATFTSDQKRAIGLISRGPGSSDDKEAKLRQLPYWQKLVDEVLKYCRHTFINFTFDYATNKMYVENYPTKDSILSQELYNTATKSLIISRHQKGVDPNRGLKVLNTLIDDNDNKRANLYAMRSTYYYALADVRNAIKDLEAAQGYDKANVAYAMAGLSYKTAIAGSLELSERLKMLSDFNAYFLSNPTHCFTAANRRVLMDKVGYLSGALAEYDKAISQEGKDAATLNNRGVARLKANRIVEAEADFLEAVQLDAKGASAYFNLAVLYAWRGFTTKTAQYLDQAITLNPDIKCEVLKNPAFDRMKSNPKFQKYGC